MGFRVGIELWAFIKILEIVLTELNLLEIALWYSLVRPFYSIIRFWLGCWQDYLIKIFVIGSFKPGHYSRYGIFHLRLWTWNTWRKYSTKYTAGYMKWDLEETYLRWMGMNIGHNVCIMMHVGFDIEELVTLDDGVTLNDQVTFRTVTWTPTHLQVAPIHIHDNVTFDYRCT
eukprot:UN27955